MKENKVIVVIGGGPAGIMAAGESAKNGNKVILLEKNASLGRKLSICGKGRCNITNDTDVNGLMANIPSNGRFLYSAFNKFSNYDIINFFNKRGLKTKVERGGRVFPVSDDACDVVLVLEKYLKERKVTVEYNAVVNKINTSDGKVVSVALQGGRTIECDAVVVATGGKSYSATGSTGDGYKFARDLGHTIEPIKPSLVPLIIKEDWVKKLWGLSLKNVSIVIRDSNKKEIYKDFGEMIFTHYGVSGPIILSASRHIVDYDYRGVSLAIDLKPALDTEKLDKRLIRDFEKYKNRQLKNSLNDLLPQKMIPVIIELSKVPEDKMVNCITKKERLGIVDLLKNLTMTIDGSRPINEAIVTKGGVRTNEIDPRTMESKIVKGLYFAGEVMDLDAYTGGFNLTIAFSTGYLAGISQV
ncbi:MAG: NAD(P)/FAD-dependent oxidoreductase [Clostridiales bacterium]|nr:NAD(P)/FAD-dependent oxidoreductase [Clostridiales bacterium]